MFDTITQRIYDTETSRPIQRIDEDRTYTSRSARPREVRDEASLPRHTALASLFVTRDASAFRPPHGIWIDLSRRKNLRRMLAALLSGRSFSVAELLEAGWPGERVSTEAGVARVHVALATLRRMGLYQVLVRGPAGYRLDSRFPIVAVGT